MDLKTIHGNSPLTPEQIEEFVSSVPLTAEPPAAEQAPSASESPSFLTLQVNRPLSDEEKAVLARAITMSRRESERGLESAPSALPPLELKTIQGNIPLTPEQQEELVRSWAKQLAD